MVANESTRIPSCGEAHAIILPNSNPPRTYWLYLPTEACQNNNNNDAHSTFPLVMALHCLGCSAQTMMHWTEIAELYHFVLVIPEGLHNSFNAPQACCGYALEHHVDDAGFLQEIIRHVSTTAFHQNSVVSDELVYAMGWSNGAYLATYTAPLFRAIAPVSGYQVPTRMAHENENRPISLFLHHAMDDTFVRITGCCSNSSMPNCCCQLDTYQNTCTSVMDHYRQWSTDVNHCSLSGQQVVSYQKEDVVCWTATGCQANTTYCQHTTGGHFNRPSFARGFPMAQEIADFFARDACRGRWSSATRKCTCDESSYGGGPYCLEHPPLQANNKTIHVDDTVVATTNLTGWPLIATLAFLAGTASLLLLRKLTREGRRYRGFRTLSMVELSSTPRRSTEH